MLAPVDRLAFVVWGDVRPGRPNDDQAYPSRTLSRLLRTAAATGAQFALGTGDYLFADRPDSVAAQLDRLLDAEASFGRPIFHALGNHECATATASNCPNGTETPNIAAFLRRLAPGVGRAYFSLQIETSQGAAKFLVLAPNAWDGTQERWLRDALRIPTRYTFVVRHEPPGTGEPEGSVAADAILAGWPLTLGFYGHAHLYARIPPNGVISGNAGAPLRRGSFGFVSVEQRRDGNIEVRAHRFDTGQVLDRWAVTPRGDPISE